MEFDPTRAMLRFLVFITEVGVLKSVDLLFKGEEIDNFFDYSFWDGSGSFTVSFSSLEFSYSSDYSITSYDPLF